MIASIQATPSIKQENETAARIRYGLSGVVITLDKQTPRLTFD
jgi:hypothetical protein